MKNKVAVPKHRRSQREGLAYHEAGHALYAYFCGAKIVKLTLKPDGQALGYCQLSRKARLSSHDAGVFLMMGPAAEARYWGRWRYRHMLGDVSDLRKLDLPELHGSCEALARFKVKECWPVIRATAAELLRAETLSGQAAERVIRDALANAK
jgi:hypothetical protein